jgi:hypothetical protein
MPPWLTDGFYRRGRSGAWYPFMLGGAPPQQVRCLLRRLRVDFASV